MSKPRILLKLTGEAFLDPDGCDLSLGVIKGVIAQIKKLRNDYQFCIVTGGGNFFRGDQQGKQLGITPWCSHQIGMLALAHLSACKPRQHISHNAFPHKSQA